MLQNGLVSHAEFRNTLESLGVDMSDEIFAKFVKLYDPGNTGNISYTRFNHNVGNMIHPRGAGKMVVDGARSRTNRPATSEVRCERVSSEARGLPTIGGRGRGQSNGPSPKWRCGA